MQIKKSFKFRHERSSTKPNKEEEEVLNKQNYKRKKLKQVEQFNFD